MPSGAKQPAEPSPLPPERTAPRGAGACAIQVLRTYPARETPYPFAPEGERSIARAYIKAFRRASRLIYLEDQYLWSFRAADELCAALRREPELLVVAVIGIARAVTDQGTHDRGRDGGLVVHQVPESRDLLGRRGRPGLVVQRRDREPG